MNNKYPYLTGGGYNQFPPIEEGLPQTLLDAIKSEAASVDFYSRLAELAPTTKVQNDLLKMAGDERIHLQSFVNLYYALTKRQPQYEVERVAFNTFEEGLQEAFDEEFKDYETYRNEYLKSRNHTIRDVFFRAFTDELKHATRFSEMINSSSNSLRNTDIPSLTTEIKDYGPDPFVVNINETTKRNNTFRTALWTGEHLQLTLMSINVGDEIGVEMHPTTDQFLRIEEGQGIVRMGRNDKQFDFEEDVYEGYAILVPAGKWHNIINTGEKPLKLYSIYAPPHHPQETVHTTKAEAIEAEEASEE